MKAGSDIHIFDCIIHLVDDVIIIKYSDTSHCLSAPVA